MTALEILQGGLVTIRKPGAYATGALARNGSGVKVKPTSPYATSWDVTGAAMRAAGTDVFAGAEFERAFELLRLAAVERGFISPRLCNDKQGQLGAVAMYRRALELAISPPARAKEGSTR